MPAKLTIGSYKQPKNTYSTPGIRIFPTQHPSVKQKDGTTSNVVVFGYQPTKDSPIYAIPSMVNGVQLEQSDAIKIAKQFGLDKYPRHKTAEEHNKWAEQFHGSISEEGVLMDRPVSSSVDDLLKRFKR
jgi:hypothetical protein